MFENQMYRRSFDRDRVRQAQWHITNRRGYRFWWFVHNVVVHPLLILYWWEWPFRLHDWSSRRLLPTKR